MNTDEPKKESGEALSPEELVQKLKACETEKEEYLNGWKRAKADLINYRREETERMETMVKFGNESLLKELLNVMDSFDLAIASMKKEEETKGIILIRSQLENMLKNRNLEPIETRGEMFNPAFHEAIAEVPSSSPPGTIVEEVSRGWKLHGKVIRAAKVTLAKET
jgi:molecular chaperone GrpE